MQGARDNHKLGWLDSKKSLDDRISEPIVFRSSDAVDEQIAEYEPGGKRGQQRPAPQMNSAPAQGGQLLDRTIRRSLCTERQRDFKAFPIGQDDFFAPLASKNSPPPRIGAGPNPERRFQPRILSCQLGDGLPLTAHMMGAKIMV